MLATHTEYALRNYKDTSIAFFSLFFHITLSIPFQVFYKSEARPVFFVASRGHHADIGGITPGSMPASSYHIQQEGILIKGELEP